MLEFLWGPVEVRECGGVCEDDLLRAASGNSVEPLKRFAQAGGALHHVRDDERRTLLHVAAFDGSSDVLELLLGLPKMLQLLNTRDKSYRTALHLAAAIGDAACARRLVEAGAAQDQKDEGGWTALHHSVKWDHVGTVRILLELASDPSLLDAGGHSAADMAESASKEVSEILASFVPRRKPTALDGLRCCLRPRRGLPQRALGGEPCDDEMTVEPSSPSCPPTEFTAEATPSPSPQLPAPIVATPDDIVPSPPVQGRSPDRDGGFDRNRDGRRDRDRNRDRERKASAFKVGSRVRVRDGDRERWQLGRVACLKPVKVRTDTANHSFVWAQMERVKDEHEGDEDDASNASEEPPPPPPIPDKALSFSGDEAWACSGAELSAEEQAEEELSAYIAEAAKRHAGSPPASPPRGGSGAGLRDKSSSSEAEDTPPHEVEWHGLEPVYKTHVAGFPESSADTRPRPQDMQSCSTSAIGRTPPGQGQGPAEAAQYLSGQAAAADSAAQGDAVQNSGEASDSEMFTDSEQESARQAGRAVLNLWSMEQSLLLADGEVPFRSLAPLMDPERCSSLSDAVDELNKGSIEVPGGMCAVFSSTRGAYFLLYREDREEEAHAEFGDCGIESTEPRVLPRAAKLPVELASAERPPSATNAQCAVSRRLDFDSPRSGPLIFRFRTYFSVDVPRLEFEVEWKGDPPVVGKTKPGGAAEQRGIVAGDLISEVNRTSTAGRTRDELLPELKLRPLLLSVDRVYDKVSTREPTLLLEFRLEQDEESNDHGMELTPAGRGGRESVLIVAGVREDSPAWVSGVMVGDAVVTVNGSGVRSARSLSPSKYACPLELKVQRWALNGSHGERAEVYSEKCSDTSQFS